MWHMYDKDYYMLKYGHLWSIFRIDCWFSQSNSDISMVRNNSNYNKVLAINSKMFYKIKIRHKEDVLKYLKLFLGRVRL